MFSSLAMRAGGMIWHERGSRKRFNVPLNAGGDVFTWKDLLALYEHGGRTHEAGGVCSVPGFFGARQPANYRIPVDNALADDPYAVILYGAADVHRDVDHLDCIDGDDFDLVPCPAVVIGESIRSMIGGVRKLEISSAFGGRFRSAPRF